MMSRYRCAIAAMLLAALLPLSGCLAARSPDQFGYALVIGVDEGEEKPFYISMLIQRGSGEEKEASGQGNPLAGVECADLPEGLSLLESSLPFSLNLSRTTALVFSRDAAKSGRMAEFLSASLGTIGIRHYANLLVSAGRAEEFLSGLSGGLNPNVAKLQYSLVEYGETTGYIPAVTLAQFYARAWNSAGDVALPLGAFIGADAQAGENEPLFDMLGAQNYLPGSIGRRGGMESGVIGAAVFSGASMAGILNGEHTQLLLMALGEFRTCRLLIPIDGIQVNVLFKKKAEPKIELQLGDEPHAAICMELYATPMENKAMQALPRETMEQEIGAYLEEKLGDIYRACRALGVDAFCLGRAAVGSFGDTAEWEAFSWADAYARTEAEFFADVTITQDSAVSRME